MSSWWAPLLNPKGLSQGDILGPLLIGTSYAPPRYLGLGPITKGSDKTKISWPQIPTWTPDSSGIGLFAARGRLVNAIVASHSCELDDKHDSSRILVAPISTLAVLDEPVRAKILAQERRAFMPLQGIPELGDYYADLRCLTYVDRRNVENVSRLASMSDEGVTRFQAQLVTFFARVDLDVTLEALRAFLAIRGEQG